MRLLRTTDERGLGQAGSNYSAGNDMSNEESRRFEEA